MERGSDFQRLLNIFRGPLWSCIQIPVPQDLRIVVSGCIHVLRTIDLTTLLVEQFQKEF